jgi:hypothetical protein
VGAFFLDLAAASIVRLLGGWLAALAMAVRLHVSRSHSCGTTVKQLLTLLFFQTHAQAAAGTRLSMTEISRVSAKRGDAGVSG